MILTNEEYLELLEDTCMAHIREEKDKERCTNSIEVMICYFDIMIYILKNIHNTPHKELRDYILQIDPWDYEDNDIELNELENEYENLKRKYLNDRNNNNT